MDAQNDATASFVSVRWRKRETGRPRMVSQLPDRDQAWASKVLPAGARISDIVVWETDTASAQYRPER